MKISNELLAAYAEGNVSQEERQAVRQYVMENPEELETVAMMMDEDYDMEVEEDNTPIDTAPDFTVGALGGMVGSFIAPTLCMSAAAFVPDFMPKFRRFSEKSKTSKDTFSQRLDNLLDELR